MSYNERFGCSLQHISDFYLHNVLTHVSDFYLDNVFTYVSDVYLGSGLTHVSEVNLDNVLTNVFWTFSCTVSWHVLDFYLGSGLTHMFRTFTWAVSWQTCFGLLPGQWPDTQVFESREDPIHCLPPFWGRGLSHSRVRNCSPTPQVLLHNPQEVHSEKRPWTVTTNQEMIKN